MLLLATLNCDGDGLAYLLLLVFVDLLSVGRFSDDRSGADDQQFARFVESHHGAISLLRDQAGVVFTAEERHHSPARLVWIASERCDRQYSRHGRDRLALQLLGEH